MQVNGMGVIDSYITFGKEAVICVVL